MRVKAGRVRRSRTRKRTGHKGHCCTFNAPRCADPSNDPDSNSSAIHFSRIRISPWYASFLLLPLRADHADFLAAHNSAKLTHRFLSSPRKREEFLRAFRGPPRSVYSLAQALQGVTLREKWTYIEADPSVTIPPQPARNISKFTPFYRTLSRPTWTFARSTLDTSRQSRAHSPEYVPVDFRPSFHTHAAATFPCTSASNFLIHFPGEM